MVQNDWTPTRELLIRHILLAVQFCDDLCQFSILEPPFRVTLSHIWSNQWMFPSGLTLLAGTPVFVHRVRMPHDPSLIKQNMRYDLHHQAMKLLAFHFPVFSWRFIHWPTPGTPPHHIKGPEVSHVFTGLCVPFVLSCFCGKHQHILHQSLF